MHRSSEQSDLGGSAMFADLKPALGEVSEVRFAKGDGSRTTLRKSADGWTVVERQYPADASRVRELVLNLASLKVVERKTQDPANYAKLGVEAPDSPTAAQHAGGGGRGQEDLVTDRRQGRRRQSRLCAQAGRGGERPGRPVHHGRSGSEALDRSAAGRRSRRERARRRRQTLERSRLRAHACGRAAPRIFP